MNMEVGIEGFVGSSSNDVSQLIVKGRRTKRLRLQSASSAGTAADAGDGDCGSFTFTETSNDESTEEDMANCLIFLARGDSQKQNAQEGGNKTGSSVYECKTCSRAFHSFQALGGHMANHKKTKVEEKKLSPTPPSTDDHDNLELEGGLAKPVKMNTSSPPRTPVRLYVDVLNQNRAKVHECSICGSEYSSGQALGGHMRRHRTAASIGQLVELSINTNHSNGTATANPMKIKSRNTLEFDLNLPAPEDDNRDSKFQHPSTQRSLFLSAPALVDCHY